MHILCKIPTRSRPEQFIKTLSSFVNNESGLHKITYLISIDYDDDSMDHLVLKKTRELIGKDGIIVLGSRAGKIGSVNRDMERAPKDYDILMQPADDWMVKKENWDDIVAREVCDSFPDLDGVVWFYDGHQPNIDTLCIMGKPYYERFNYIYYPEYVTFWADNEFTEVANLLDRLSFCEEVVFEHQHPDWIYSNGYDGKFKGYDQLYHENNKQEDRDWDERLFYTRRLINFGLKNI